MTSLWGPPHCGEPGLPRGTWLPAVFEVGISPSRLGPLPRMDEAVPGQRCLEHLATYRKGTAVTAVPDVPLNNGRTIPQFGFGVFQIRPADTAAAVATALEAGYQHIDTAEMYGNEKEVGTAIAKSGLDRADVFVTSKLNNGFHRPDDARLAFDESLDALGFDYLDLFLIHWPLPTRYDGDYVSTWQALEEFYRDGRARSIGVSNFQPHHLRRLHAECDITPAINQIEIHPYLT